MKEPDFSKLRKCRCCGQVFGIPRITGPKCRCDRYICPLDLKCMKHCKGHSAEELKVFAMQVTLATLGEADTTQGS